MSTHEFLDQVCLSPWPSAGWSTRPLLRRTVLAHALHLNNKNNNNKGVLIQAAVIFEWYVSAAQGTTQTTVEETGSDGWAKPR